MNEKNFTNRQRVMLDILQPGIAVPRTEISRRAGVDDRTARGIIQSLRDKGVRIGSVDISKDNRAYIRFDNDEDYNAWKPHYLAPALSILRAVAAMDNMPDEKQEEIENLFI